MAVEKMCMVNLIGPFEDFDKLTKLLAFEGFIQPINALQEINSSDFSLETSENTIEALMDVSYIRPYVYEKDYGMGFKQIEELTEEQKKLNIYDDGIKEVYFNFSNIEKKLSSVYEEYQELKRSIDEIKEKNNKLKNTYEALRFMKDIKIPTEEIFSMGNFKTSLYRVKNDSMVKLKANYENIPSVIKSVHKDKDFSIFIAFTPEALRAETEKIFKSANCEELSIAYDYKGIPQDVLKAIQVEMDQYEKSINELEFRLRYFLIKNYKNIKIIENSFELEEKAGEIKKMAACTNEFFYLSGWVPQSCMPVLEKVLENFYERILIVKKKPGEVSNQEIIPPTKLKNHKFIKPFQSIVTMYGIPSYNEIDPTFFLAVTYTLMFGAMFGDVGQGLVLFAAGFYLKNRRRNINIGGVLEVLGISSALFGFLYGSVFGFEDIIDAVLVRPMDDINDVLAGAIVFGCLILIMGFILGIVNKLKIRDVEQGFFGKEGLAGFCFYIVVLIVVAGKLTGYNLIPLGAAVMVMILSLAVIFLKQPLANIVKGNKPLFNEGIKDYFVEAVFELIETILSMFSNTLSFIRVGAFALNHVGLFVAFAAMAEMANNGAASALILVIGNIVIIGLEGLIVFIQGLRLQYYELFSKYYEGGGIPFEPVKVKFH